MKALVQGLLHFTMLYSFNKLMYVLRLYRRPLTILINGLLTLCIFNLTEKNTKK
jgi:hypothetical protein